MISKVMDVPLVPYTKWLNTLEESARSSTRLPASSLQLLDFYRSANRSLNSEDEEAFGFPRLSTSQAQVSVPILSNFKKLGLGDVTAWLPYWTSSGVLTKV